MTKYLGTLLGAFLLLVLVGGGCAPKTEEMPVDSQDDAMVEDTTTSDDTMMEETTKNTEETMDETEDGTPAPEEMEAETTTAVNATPEGAVKAYYEARIAGGDGSEYLLPSAATHPMVMQMLDQMKAFTFSEVSVGDVTDVQTEGDMSDYTKAFGEGTYKYVMTTYKADMSGSHVGNADDSVVKEENGLWFVVRPAL